MIADPDSKIGPWSLIIDPERGMSGLFNPI